MEMQIAQMSMAMAMQNLQSSVSVGMMKKSMEATEANMDAMTEMLDNMPSPDGKGTMLNVLA